MFRDWMHAAGRAIGHLAEARRHRPPIVFLNQRWSHHGAHSGYLIDVATGPTLPRDERVFPHPLKLLVGRVLKDSAWEPRLLSHLMLRAGGSQLLHLVDGDFDTWAYSKRPRWLNTKITATFHQTPDRLGEIVKTLRAGMLDGIVCVSRDQLSLLEHLVPDGRCVFIPHGVDTGFFDEAPAAPAVDSALLLAVGVHRRDFATLMAAARIIKSRRPGTRIRLIGPRERIADVARSGSVETVSDLSDVELRAAYREASLLFLPLEAATANNALLESMATGRPAVITDLPGIRDYTAPDAARLCARGDAEAHACAALELLEDDSLRERMGRAARRRALEFHWPTVWTALAAYLRGVCGPGVGAAA
jgi:glycosyltransferase involved in cell wall biosynthesis